jgi:CobQ-like glutamine amidotransferase family enzyme
MEIKILHLLYDLMNLYGEYGNVNVIKYRLENQGANVVVDKKTIGDEINFNDYDFIYMGSGTEKNQLVALDFLKKYKKDLDEAINNKKVILFTGNSFELLGKELTLENGEKRELLNTFDFNVVQKNDRIIGDVIIKPDFIEQELVGFINKQAVIESYNYFSSKVIFGVGADEKNEFEGIHKNNLYGTYIIGPVLAKNPSFAKLIEDEIIKSKDENSKFKEVDYTQEESDYNMILTELKSRMENK